MEKIILKIFGSPDRTVFLLVLLSAGDSIYSRENLLENLGTPVKTCLICKGTAEKSFENLAVVIILSPISSVCGIE